MISKDTLSSFPLGIKHIQISVCDPKVDYLKAKEQFNWLQRLIEQLEPGQEKHSVKSDVPVVHKVRSSLLKIL